MRSNQELLQVFLNNTEYFYRGIPQWSVELYVKGLLTWEEKTYIRELLEKDRANSEKKASYGYYWDIGIMEPRIKWLKEHLS